MNSLIKKSIKLKGYLFYLIVAVFLLVITLADCKKNTLFVYAEESIADAIQREVLPLPHIQISQITREDGEMYLNIIVESATKSIDDEGNAIPTISAVVASIDGEIENQYRCFFWRSRSLEDISQDYPEDGGFVLGETFDIACASFSNPEATLSIDILGEEDFMMSVSGKLSDLLDIYSYDTDRVTDILNAVNATVQSQSESESQPLEIEKKDDFENTTQVEIWKDGFFTRDDGILVGSAKSRFAVSDSDVNQDFVLCYSLSGAENVVSYDEARTSISFVDNYYGNIVVWAEDILGNKTLAEEYTVWIDAVAPEIAVEFTRNETDERLARVSAKEVSNIYAAFSGVKVYLDGEEQTYWNYREEEVTEEDCYEKKTLTGIFDVYLGETGDTTTLAIEVVDVYGNTARWENSVPDEELNEVVEVEITEDIDLTIIPMWNRAVYSSEIWAVNKSECDVELSVNGSTLVVNRDNLGLASSKDVELYLIRSDTGERIPLIEGANEAILTQLVLPGFGDVYFTIEGTVSKGSEKLWRKDDLFVCIDFSYKPIHNGE